MISKIHCYEKKSNVYGLQFVYIKNQGGGRWGWENRNIESQLGNYVQETNKGWWEKLEK